MNLNRRQQLHRRRYLRQKQESGAKLTEKEGAELAELSALPEMKRGRKPSQGLGAEEESPKSPDIASAEFEGDEPPRVESELPGVGQARSGPPPVDTAAQESEADQKKASGSGPSNGQEARSASPPPPPPPNRDAEASFLADYATQILAEFNDYNVKNGKMGLNDVALKMFHMSTKRLAQKWGASIDEETYDYLVVAGAGGFVGYQTWRVQVDKKEKETETPKQTGNVAPQPRPTNGAPIQQPIPVNNQLPHIPRVEEFRGNRPGSVSPDFA